MSSNKFSEPEEGELDEDQQPTPTKNSKLKCKTHPSNSNPIPSNSSSSSSSSSSSCQDLNPIPIPVSSSSSSSSVLPNHSIQSFNQSSQKITSKSNHSIDSCSQSSSSNLQILSSSSSSSNPSISISISSPKIISIQSQSILHSPKQISPKIKQNHPSPSNQKPTTDHIISKINQSNQTLSNQKIKSEIKNSNSISQNNLNPHSNSISDHINSSNSPIKKFYQNYQPTFFFHHPFNSNSNSNSSSFNPNKSFNQTTIPFKSNQNLKKIFVGVSSIESYELLDKLGEGTFGEVFKGIYRGRQYAKNQNSSSKIIHQSSFSSSDNDDHDHDDQADLDDNLIQIKSKVKIGMVVALKRIIIHNELDGLPITALREIRILKSLDHPNIVPVVDLAFSNGNKNSLKRGNTYMIFPYIDHDLAGLMENKSITFSVSQIKIYSKQLLLGTAYLHRNKILHRDLKAANLLISNTGQLLIADFGLARSIEQQSITNKREYTNCVVTRWYRPPEILLGNRRYGTPVDMWGVGCVIGEMFKGGPILTGTTDVNQCELIFKLCGNPTSKSMPNWDKLPGCEGVRSWANKPRRVREEYERISPELADLLDKLLVLDPSKRFTAEQALDHIWFWTDPMALDPAKLPHYEPSHEYDRRKKDHQQPIKKNQHAAFTSIQSSSSNSNFNIKPNQGPQTSQSRILPSLNSNSRLPNLPPSNDASLFPTQINHHHHPNIHSSHEPILESNPIPSLQSFRPQNNHTDNPYSVYGSNPSMKPNGRLGANPINEDRHQYPNHAIPGVFRPQTHAPYPAPLPTHGMPIHPIPSISHGQRTTGSYGPIPSTLPPRPQVTYDRRIYEPMSAGNRVQIGMRTGPPNGMILDHFNQHRAYPCPSDQYMLMGPPPSTLPNSRSAQRTDTYSKINNGYPQPTQINGGPIGEPYRRSAYGIMSERGGTRRRGPAHRGPREGRLRDTYDRWVPDQTSQSSATEEARLAERRQWNNGRLGQDGRYSRVHHQDNRLNEPEGSNQSSSNWNRHNLNTSEDTNQRFNNHDHLNHWDRYESNENPKLNY
ncbi:hypothetical protein O181_036843 [Austropuccinia psidii MF-1]|uniref:[RNA-polymerase]-subunit kinase n=1 Tax=Austropuccinia psidii MF-1 TaxID=1389203 RepID=A0A9Q3DA81_9BASI|nr:hypothetical protein [Austropuccinia psidii MF-1]